MIIKLDFLADYIIKQLYTGIKTLVDWGVRETDYQPVATKLLRQIVIEKYGDISTDSAPKQGKAIEYANSDLVEAEVFDVLS